jgi:hypothetical protein
MLLELVTGFGIFILILVILAETTKKPIVGAIASLVLLVLAMWIFLDGIQYKIGQDIVKTENTTTNSSLNSSTSLSAQTSEVRDIYTDLPSFSIVPMGTLIPLLFVLLSMYGLMNYGMDLFNY